ncbi:hypothetical protein M3Y99_01451600 [Aphelenchoides fujianensis]|nr:hypothetical protein M3Y99_01451600 [Aphelenchoides fujianensis]
MDDSNGFSSDISHLRIPVTWLYGSRFACEDKGVGRKNSEGIGNFDSCYTWSRYGPIRSGAAVFGCAGCRKIRDARRKQTNGLPPEKRVVPTILIDLNNEKSPFFKRLVLPTHQHFCAVQSSAECHGGGRSPNGGLMASGFVNASRLVLEPFIPFLHAHFAVQRPPAPAVVPATPPVVPPATPRRRKQSRPMKLPSTPPSADEKPAELTPTDMLQRLVGFFAIQQQ